MSNVGELLREGAASLTQVDDGVAEAQLLLGHLLGRDRAWLYAWSDRAVEDAVATRFRELVAQRADGTPMAYLTGTRCFWSLQLAVNAHTLIPRPETELLVERALAFGDPQRPLRVLDLGTGSGAIALAVAAERPAWQVLACDRSEPALQAAQDNARRLGIANVQFVLSDWFEAVDGRFDLLLSNPPYIADDDPHLARGDLRFEPRSALAAGVDGLDDIRRIVAAAPAHLLAGGQLWVEHGFDQGAACRRLFDAAGFVAVRSERDLAGHERLTGGEIPT